VPPSNHQNQSSSRQSGAPREGGVEHLVEDAKETLSAATSTVSQAAQEAYTQGSDYARQTLDNYPGAQRYYREGTEAVRHQAAENPMLTFLMGIGVGYAAAWMLHAVKWGHTEEVPDYARTRRDYGRGTRDF